MFLGGIPGLGELLSSIPEITEGMGSAVIDAINSPHVIEQMAEASEGFGPSLIDKIKTFLEDEKNQKMLGLGADVVEQIIKAKSIDDAEPAPIRAAPYRGPRPSQVNIPRIGYAAEGGDSSILGRKLFIAGGEVDGPGGPKEDMVPIWASDQEYVVSADAVKKLGGGSHSQGIAALDKLNFGK